MSSAPKVPAASHPRPPDSTPETPEARELARREARRKLAAAEAELARARSELSRLGTAQALPGLFLEVEVAGHVALVPADAVREVVRLVAFEPLPGAPPHVLGAFLYRGAPALAVDVARRLGVVREPDVDAHLVVCGAEAAGGRALALVVDRVRGIVQEPVLVDGAAEEGSGAAASDWDATGMSAGLCRAGDGLVPLLRVSAALAGEGASA